MRCGFKDWFERVLRGGAAEFVKQQVRKANDPSAEGESAPIGMQKTTLVVILDCLLGHANKGFSRPALDAMVASARRDARKYWTYAQCYWSRTVGEDPSAIRLPENMRALENEFWQRVDAAISEALGERGTRPAKRKRRNAG